MSKARRVSEGEEVQLLHNGPDMSDLSQWSKEGGESLPLLLKSKEVPPLRLNVNQMFVVGGWDREAGKWPYRDIVGGSLRVF